MVVLLALLYMLDRFISNTGEMLHLTRLAERATRAERQRADALAEQVEHKRALIAAENEMTEAIRQRADASTRQEPAFKLEAVHIVSSHRHLYRMTAGTFTAEYISDNSDDAYAELMSRYREWRSIMPGVQRL